MTLAQAMKWLFVVMIATVIVCLGDTPLLAQGCSMCNTVASAQAEPAVKALNRGILLLLIPPVAIMGAILFWAFKFRNSSADLESPAVQTLARDAHQDLKGWSTGVSPF